MSAPTEVAAANGYHNLWNQAEVRSNRQTEAKAVAMQILAAKSRLEAVEKATGVPWQWIGAIFSLEAGLNWKGAFANGDAIIGTGRKTWDVPANRGPFATWEESAIDEIKRRGLDKIPHAHWSVEMMLFQAEAYNGWGYLGKCNSPYDWSFTTAYGPPEAKGGKYVRDNVFSASAISSQCGCAAIWKELALVDNDTNLFLSLIRNVSPPDPKLIPAAAKKATAGPRATAAAASTVAVGGATGSAGKASGAIVDIHSSVFIALIVVGVVVAGIAISLTIKTGNLLKARW